MTEQLTAETPLKDLDEVFPHFQMLPDDEPFLPLLGRLLIHCKYHIDKGELLALEIANGLNQFPAHTFIKMWLTDKTCILAMGETASQLYSDWSACLENVDKAIQEQNRIKLAEESSKELRAYRAKLARINHIEI